MQRQCFWWAISNQNSKAALGMNLRFECRNWWYILIMDAWGYPQTISIIEKKFKFILCWYFFLNLELFSLFESVIRLVPAKLWNFLEVRMLYDKCIENWLWSYPCRVFFTQCLHSFSLEITENPDCMFEKSLVHHMSFFWLVGWLCYMSHRQRGHLETAPPFTVPCKGREAQ